MAVTDELLARPRNHRHAAARPGRRVVRPALPNEAAVLSCLHRSLARDAFLFETSIPVHLADGGAIVLVCEVSEAIAGYLCLGDSRLVLDGRGLETQPEIEAGSDESAARWTLRAFGVTPQFRRTGVATDLWQAALDLVPDSVTTVTGDVRPDKGAAASWLYARGFALDPVPIAPVGPERATGALDGVAPFIPAVVRERRFTADVAALRANLRSAGHA